MTVASISSTHSPTTSTTTSATTTLTSATTTGKAPLTTAAVASTPFSGAGKNHAGRATLGVIMATTLGVAGGALSAYAFGLPIAASASVLEAVCLVTNFLGRVITKKTPSTLTQFMTALASSILALKIAALIGYSFAKLSVIAATWYGSGALVGISFFNGASLVVVGAIALTVLGINLASNLAFKKKIPLVNTPVYLISKPSHIKSKSEFSGFDFIIFTHTGSV